MKVGKPKSKRVPVRLRHKIEKASASKQRKQRKEAKKNPQWRSRLKKDPGIPNLFPYKDKILAEVEEGRRRKEEAAQKKRELSKAQKKGTDTSALQTDDVAEGDEGDSAEDEEIYDLEDEGDGDSRMQEDSSNPMAALLASAQARASAYSKDDQAVEDEDDDDDDAGVDAAESKHGILDSKTKGSTSTRKALPKQAVADPIKAVSVLVTRLEKTQHGMQQLLDHYQIPPLVTAGSDTTSRFLVDVARKRGRMGRGGVPNLHSAALTVLSDLNDERMKLPALDTQLSSTESIAKGEVQIVAKMAEPFRIEGLFNDDGSKHTAMDLE